MPRIGDGPKKGIKKQRSRRAWAGLDEILASVKEDDSKSPPENEAEKDQVATKARGKTKSRGKNQTVTRPADSVNTAPQPTTGKSKRPSEPLASPTSNDDPSPTHAIQKNSTAPSGRSKKVSEQNSGTKCRNKMTEQNNGTEFRNKIGEQNTGTNEKREKEDPDTHSQEAEQNSGTKNRNTITEHNNGTEFRNKIAEQNSGTNKKRVSEAPKNTRNQSDDNKRIVGSSGTESRNTIPEQNTDTERRNIYPEPNAGTNRSKETSSIEEGGRKLEKSSGTKYRNKVPEQNLNEFKAEKVMEQSSGTESRDTIPEQSSRTVPEQVPELSKSTGTNHPEFRNKFQNSSSTEFRNNMPEQYGSASPKEVHLLPDEDKDFTKLIGLRKKIVMFVYDQCIRHETNALKTTYEFLAKTVGGRKESVQTTCKRLKKQPGAFFEIESQARGPGAPILIRIDEKSIRRYMSFRDQATQSTGTEVEQNTGTSSGTLASSSSSNNINNKTTTTTQLPEDWREIIIPDNVRAIGFGSVQLKQLFKLDTLDASTVQDSLDAFAYDLEAGAVKSRGSKLNFLMGILRSSGGYVSDAYLEELKSAIEANKRRIKEKEELEKQQAEEKLAAKAEQQMAELSDEQKRELVPENSIMRMGSSTHDRMVLQKLKEQLIRGETDSH